MSKVIKGADLMVPPQPKVDVERFTYWTGALESCPFSCPAVAGVEFPKVTEQVMPAPMGQMNPRIPQVGALVRLTRAQVQKVAASLPQKVLRFRANPDAAADAALEARGLRSMVKSAAARRSAYLLHVPTEEERTLLAREGRLHRTYLPADGDEPLAMHVFMVLADERGKEVPPPVGVTGITLPPEPPSAE